MILPPPLQRYFDANAALDLDAMVAPFGETAIVQDEGEAHQGKDEIRAWIQQATIAASAIGAPKAILSDAQAHEVTAEVSGAFPGSPVMLAFRFVLDGDRIVKLEIA